MYVPGDFRIFGNRCDKFIRKIPRVAGNKIDEAIANYTKKKFNLLIGERTAEEIKVTLGNALIEDGKKDPQKMSSEARSRSAGDIRGRDSITGLPRTIELTEIQINEAIKPVLLDIIQGVKGVLEQTPPELASDIIDKGMVLSGGGALLRNLDQLITKIIGVPCYVAEDPLFCVIKGIGIALENLEMYKRTIMISK